MNREDLDELAQCVLTDIVRVKPQYVGIAPEPCQLFSGIAASVALYLEDGFVEGEESVQVAE